ncbi:hypothetical protein [Actinomycetospora termitidis]|uniref:Cobalamin-binding protein n=1 Tax=Actinomycetospora termitidis TaxID=3053470 RepID=A0ABT7M670_9PSEU|nr:hypothetical protein [Actinomycetospora sp. Odt1-22]MDL5154963.1 hypothetical protein [Actinomycetospora sp. Odt1-22]
MRIASLLPATTEIVGALGRADDLVAITFECDHPPGLTAPVVVRSALAGDLTPGEIDRTVRERAAAGLPMYDLDREALRAAAPDVVLTQDLCGVCALPGHTVTEVLAEIGLPDVAVHSFDPHTFDEVLGGIADLAAAIDADAGPLLSDLRRRLAAVETALVDGRVRAPSCWSGPTRRSSPATGSPSSSAAPGPSRRPVRTAGGAARWRGRTWTSRTR